MLLKQESENKEVFVEGQADGGKKLKLSPSFFTATYSSLLKKNKAALKMKESEQVDLFWKCCFIFVIQMAFSYVIFAFGGLKASVFRAPEMHFSLFFSVLILHFVCMPVARDGLTMMKYALLHHDEFNHPISAFMLGFFNLFAMTVAELVNMLNSQSKKTIPDAIASFLGFNLLINLPTVFMNSFEEFPQKGAVKTLEQKRRRADKERPLMAYNWLFNLVYVVSAMFYKALFFYFFPFGSSAIPFIRSLEGNISGNN